MEIPLDLTRHCIETESKKIHNRLIQSYFKSENEKESLELAIDAIKLFLEQVDFSKLRFDYPDLAGSTIDASLIIKSTQSIVIQLDNRRIPITLVS